MGRFPSSTPTTSAPARSCGRSIPFPREGEPGNDTWAKDSWKNRTGNNVWAFALTVDEERGILYIPVSGPGANFYGGDRPGANLFGNTLVALDANTGKMKWYFQTVHHELWDYNLPPAPGLIDIKKDGKKIPALAQVGKSGYMYHSGSRDRQAGLRRRGTSGGEKSNVPGEESLSDAADSGEAAADFANQHDERRYRYRRGHDAGSRQSLPGTMGTFGTPQRRVHSRRSRITPKVTNRNPRSFFRDSRAERIGAARRPIRSSATFS